MNTAFEENFGALKDPRIDRTKKHALLDIMALGILGVMAGAQGYEEIEDFGKAHESWLKQYLKLENGIPSHDTISRLFERLNHQAFQKAFLGWVGCLKELFKETIIPIDGKTLRGSHQASKDLRALHVISAWSCANGLSLGQLKVDGKTNEITAIPELLQQLMLKGAIVTLDAMGCQKEITKALCAQEADYVIALKGNQGQLEKTVSDCFDKAQTVVSTAQDEIGCEHGRIEERKIELLEAEVLKRHMDISEWSCLRTVAKVTRTVRVKSTGLQTVETHFYISSLEADEPQRILKAIRAHWTIESMHWSLDVTFNEDACRVREETAALNLSYMRKMALSLLKAEPSFKASIRRKQLKLWRDPAYLLKVLPTI